MFCLIVRGKEEIYGLTLFYLMFPYLQAQAKAATENSEKAKQAEV